MTCSLNLVEAIAVAKVKAVEESIALVHRLKNEVGSYALMAGTGTCIYIKRPQAYFIKKCKEGDKEGEGQGEGEGGEKEDDEEVRQEEEEEEEEEEEREE